MGITSTGIGSGLDVESIITQLMTIEKQPLTALQKQQSSIQTKISAYGKIQSSIATLRDKANAMTSTSLWGSTTTTLSDSSVATVTPISGQTGMVGSHSLKINSLAGYQTISSVGFNSSSATLSEGSLTIEMGSWTGGGTTPTGFTAKSGSSPITVTIGTGETSLTSICAKINAAGAGVSASIITDASGARLSLRSTSTGAENAFRVTTTEAVDDGVASTGLSALAYDATTTSPMTRTQASSNAQVEIDGIAVESASNTLDGVIHGVSIKLQKTTTSAVSMDVASDQTSLSTAVNDLVTAYNATNDLIKSQIKYDAATKTAGTLQGDASANSLLSSMRSLLTQSFNDAAAGSFHYLSDVGLSFDSSGDLQLNSSKWNAAMTSPDKVQALFTKNTAGGTLAVTGFMRRLRDFADAAQASSGTLQNRTTGLQSDLKRNQSIQDSMQTRMTATEARLRKQYTDLDAKMTQMNSLSSSVSLMVSNFYR